MNKELQSLKQIKKTLRDKNNGVLTELQQKRFEIIETALKKLKQIETNQTIFENNPITVGKKIMALEIIKKKNVFYVQKFIRSKTLEKYNASLTEKEQLTQEEFGLLKEVLK